LFVVRCHRRILSSRRADFFPAPRVPVYPPRPSIAGRVAVPPRAPLRTPRNPGRVYGHPACCAAEGVPLNTPCPTVWWLRVAPRTVVGDMRTVLYKSVM